MSLPRSVLLACALLMCQASYAQDRVFCCKDANGQNICGDTLPPACYERSYKSISRGGRVTEVEGALTPEQRAKREAEQKALKTQAAEHAAAIRRDRVLLESYASLADLDKRRDRELGILDVEIKNAGARETQLLGIKADLEKQKAKLGNKPNRKIDDGLESNASELASVRMILTGKQHDYDVAKARFDGDRKRYLELTTSTSASSPIRQ